MKLYISIFRKTVGKIQVSLKSGKNSSYFIWRPIHIFYHTRSVLLFSVGLPVANAPDVLQPCGLLYYPWCSNSHHQSVVFQEILAVRGAAKTLFLDVPIFTTSRLPRDPSSQTWKYVGKKWPMNFAWNARLPRSIQESLTCHKSTTWDRQLYFPSEERRAEDFFALKNPTASAGFKPANLGTKGQHATSRPPKPLSPLLLRHNDKLTFIFAVYRDANNTETQCLHYCLQKQRIRNKMRIQEFWNVMLCHWVCFPKCRSVQGLILVKWKLQVCYRNSLKVKSFLFNMIHPVVLYQYIIIKVRQ